MKIKCPQTEAARVKAAKYGAKLSADSVGLHTCHGCRDNVDRKHVIFLLFCTLFSNKSITNRASFVSLFTQKFLFRFCLKCVALYKLQSTYM